MLKRVTLGNEPRPPEIPFHQYSLSLRLDLQCFVRFFSAKECSFVGDSFGQRFGAVFARKCSVETGVFAEHCVCFTVADLCVSLRFVHVVVRLDHVAASTVDGSSLLCGWSIGGESFIMLDCKRYLLSSLERQLFPCGRMGFHWIGGLAISRHSCRIGSFGNSMGASCFSFGFYKPVAHDLVGDTAIFCPFHFECATFQH